MNDGFYGVRLHEDKFAEIWSIKNDEVVEGVPVACMEAMGYTFEPVVVLTVAEHEQLLAEADAEAATTGGAYAFNRGGSIIIR
mgnify:CR=1 FL=1